MDRNMENRSIENLSAALYFASEDNDLTQVRQYLLLMKIKEINYQMSSDDNTALHVATRNGHVPIVKLLLDFYATRSLRNYHDQIPYDLAQTDEVRQLFQRPRLDSRFIFVRKSNSLSTSSAELDISCNNCFVGNDGSFYEWELIDPNAPQKALHFRRELKPSTTKRLVNNRIYSINNGYLKERLTHIPSSKCILNWFTKAGEEDDPTYIVKAYTHCQIFSNLLNSDMARNVIHNIRNGCSKFCCDYLYSTEDGVKSIATILLYHPQFQNLSFVGKVYRGFVIKESKFSHYLERSCIITTTFLSTSENPNVAEMFSGQGDSLSPSDDISVLCIYTIKSQNRIALRIAEISEFPHEDEVLILPYSAFQITKITKNDQQRQTEIHLEECDAMLLSSDTVREEEQHSRSNYNIFGSLNSYWRLK